MTLEINLDDIFGSPGLVNQILTTKFWAFIPNPDSTDDTFVADMFNNKEYCDYSFTFDLFYSRDAVLDIRV